MVMMLVQVRWLSRFELILDTTGHVAMFNDGNDSHVYKKLEGEEMGVYKKLCIYLRYISKSKNLYIFKSFFKRAIGQV